jgi:predicted NBD/HSP70 family sugar kinase
MSVLAIDIGGTNIKILATGQKEPRKLPSGAEMTPKQMVDGVKRLAGDWQYDVVSIGYPGMVKEGRLVSEPTNLAPGWVGFDFERAFGRPVKLINDAAMQERRRAAAPARNAATKNEARKT